MRSILSRQHGRGRPSDRRCPVPTALHGHTFCAPTPNGPCRSPIGDKVLENDRHYLHILPVILDILRFAVGTVSPWFLLRYISSPTISAEGHHIPYFTFVTLASDTCQITNVPSRRGYSWRWGQPLRPAHHRSPAPNSETQRCCPTPRAPPRRCCKCPVRPSNLQRGDLRVCTHFFPL